MAKQAKAPAAPKITLRKGATAKRGMMLKMVEAVTKAPLTRDDLGSASARSPAARC
jgi:hypothetical protein